MDIQPMSKKVTVVVARSSQHFFTVVKEICQFESCYHCKSTYNSLSDIFPTIFLPLFSQIIACYTNESLLSVSEDPEVCLLKFNFLQAANHVT